LFNGAERTIFLFVALKAPRNSRPIRARRCRGEYSHLDDPGVTWLVRQPAGAEVRVTLEADTDQWWLIPETI
jgi:hypothetical protein